MKKIVLGILAHVDSGKTTLSEALLYHAGLIKKLGRVDHKSSVLDNEPTERTRGITIFSKQATIFIDNVEITLLDTPGHVDFGAEMERTLDVLDAAILVINGASGVQSHTITLWKLLKKYQLPVFIFVNKMDISHFQSLQIIDEMKEKLGEGFFPINGNLEDLAVLDEALFNHYIDTEKISHDLLVKAISIRNIFLCYFGSALNLEGTDKFLHSIVKYLPDISYNKEFSAIIYRISRDPKGKRLTHMKITGGRLSVRDKINGEKVNEIRIYVGGNYKNLDKVEAGSICAITGLDNSYAGMTIGDNSKLLKNILEPVLTYNVILQDKVDKLQVLDKLKILEEELPELDVEWIPELKEIHIKVMGIVQLEIIENLMKERFNINLIFDKGSILYKEKVLRTVEGVGHFEPLRHYAEVHLLLEPGKMGSGIVIKNKCSSDTLGISYQNLILGHIKEKVHLGVLTGSPLTDTRITLISGQSSIHTSGGDFREATFRAIRQGLMEAGCVLLEPFYKFDILLPKENVGRLLTDIKLAGGETDAPVISQDKTRVSGRVPVSFMEDYAKEFISYTKGKGNLSIANDGYDICKNQDEIVKNISYDVEHDIENPASSIFCKNGTGFTVPWHDVKNHMHLESTLVTKSSQIQNYGNDFSIPNEKSLSKYKDIDNSNSQDNQKLEEELQKIFERTYGPIKDRRNSEFKYYGEKKKSSSETTSKSMKNKSFSYKGRENPDIENLIIIDGYNLIYSWDKLAKIGKDDLTIAREELLHILANYRAYKGCKMLVVFDAYNVKDGLGSHMKIHGIDIVYTKEGQTADSYIEKLTYEISKKYLIRVVTSDALEQLIIMGNGALRISSQSFINEVNTVEEEIRSLL